MKVVKLTNGGECKVDEEDYDLLIKYNWQKSPNGYAYRSCKRENILMHRFILNLTKEKIDVDHVNRDRLDNRKSNLRTASRSDNMSNSLSHRDAYSKYKGVSWSKGMKKWEACLVKNYVKIYKGHFDSETEAARAYDKAAKEHFGEFARLNFGHGESYKPGATAEIVRILHEDSLRTDS